MTRIAHVLRHDPVRERNDGHSIEILVDEADPKTCKHFADCGDDSCPLPGDFAAVDDSDYCSGGEQITGYWDPLNQPRAQPGEKRIYSRNTAGEPVAEIHLHGDGSITVESLSGGGFFSLAANGEINLNGVVITTSGEIRAPGEVTAMAETPATAVSLSTHLHPTGVGPTSAPTPGT